MSAANDQRTISVQFFASLREALGCEQLALNLPAELAVSDLIGLIAETLAEAVVEGQAETAAGAEAAGLADQRAARVLAIRSQLEATNVRLAHNQSVHGSPELRLQNGDQLAFLPPVTGG